MNRVIKSTNGHLIVYREKVSIGHKRDPVCLSVF